MYEIFEEIFWQVAEENGFTAWYELFDSELMEEVESRIEARCGLSDEYFIWYNEMAEELWKELFFFNVRAC